jgi:uncharacterized protein
MKSSFYNIQFEYKGNIFVFNTLRGALAGLDDEYLDVLQGKKEKNINAAKELINQGFMVEDDLNEYESVKNNFFRGKYSDGMLSITILPSLACNFRCPYCYQCETTETMSEDVVADLISFVNSFTDIHELDVCWFGGEPLLQLKIIEKITCMLRDFCRENGVEYNASMVSNGYLLSKKYVALLKDLQVRNVQITIDGPKEIHNKRRRHKADDIDTFSKCLKGIALLNECGIRADIRINVDKSNVETIEELLEIIAREQFDDITLDFARVRSFTEKCADVDNSFFSIEEFEKIELELKKKAYYLGLCDIDSFLPRTKTIYCGAEKTRNYSIGPAGDMYKCWCDVGKIDLSFGNIKNAERDMLTDKELSYLSFSPFSDKECINCKLLPICMKGCVKEAHQIKTSCREKQEAVLEGLRFYLENCYE